MDADVVVIGGGPSGLMAAISARMHGADTLLIDKGDRLGRKLGISGGGRCNVTNAGDIEHIIRHIPGNGRFLYSAFSVFNNRDIIRFFEDMGIALKEEDHGRMFPVTDSAQTVVRALVNRARELGVRIRVNEPVKRLALGDDRVSGVILADGQRLSSRCVIVASGGKSVPHTGSTGDGYAWAEEAGHTVTELYPTEVPIVSHESFVRERKLQGLSLRDVEIGVLNAKGKKIIVHRGDLIFTHFGISGPSALRCSQFVVKELKKTGSGSVTMVLDLMPDWNREEVERKFEKMVRNEPGKSVKNVLKSVLPERMVVFLLEQSGLRSETTAHHLPGQPWRRFLDHVKGFSFQVHGTLPVEKAFVTGGGVHLKEIVPQTMESRIRKGLFFCGEILDIHGYTGGYNITAAFVTGYTAGKHAAESVHPA